MCGIAGIRKINESIDPTQIRRMTNVIAHRGPDGEGHWFSPAVPLALGHRRLAILDLSEQGAQPMVSANGRYVLCFNGEIYNYLELKAELTREGIPFAGHSDTEVLLQLFIKYGAECLSMLDGMFAFVIWDEEAQSLFCARDRFGEKPFYYHHQAGNTFLFASEMKALFAADVHRKVNARMVFNYLGNNYQYPVTNPTDLAETFFEDVYALEPAHYITVDRNLAIKKQRYWSLQKVEPNQGLSLSGAAEALQEMLTVSVSKRLRADVPVGSGLSGGMDSTSIVYLIDKLRSGQEQLTFSARFENYSLDEGKFIDVALQGVHAKSYSTWPSEAGLIQDIDKMFYHQEEPFPTTSIFAQWQVMKLAAANHTTVLLDGQGADEILGGYLRFLHTYLRSLLSKPTALDSELNAIRAIHRADFPDPRIAPERTKQTSFLSLLKPKSPFGREFPGQFIFSKQFYSQFETKDLFALPSKFKDLNTELVSETEIYGLGSLLRYVDRNSMAHSREVRLPFLDHNLVEFLFALPAEFKIQGGWTKRVLREAMQNIIPTEIAWRKDKIGYTTPQEKWQQNAQLQERIADAKSDMAANHILHGNLKPIDYNFDWNVLCASMLYQKP